MKVNEIISEAVSNNQAVKPKGKTAKMHPHHADPIPGLSTVPDLPGMYYGMYRFGVHMAGSPENPSHENGPTANFMVTTAYTDEDAEIVNHTAKSMGMKIKAVTGKDSSEPVETNSTSPIAKPKRNKYGV